MTTPEQADALFASIDESPAEQAKLMFYESTDAYCAAIQAGIVSSRSSRTQAVKEVERTANLMDSSFSMLVGLLFDTDPPRYEEQVAGVLHTHELLQREFYVHRVEKPLVSTEGVEDGAHRLTLAQEYLQEHSGLTGRELMVASATRALLQNSQAWMYTFSIYGKIPR